MNPLRTIAALTRGQQLIAAYVASAGVGLTVCVAIAPNAWFVMVLWALATAVFVGDTRGRRVTSTRATPDETTACPRIRKNRVESADWRRDRSGTGSAPGAC